MSEQPDAGKSAADAEAGSSAASDTHSWIEHPTTVKRLQILVVVLGVFLIAGFATVIGRIAYMTMQSGSEPAANLAANPTAGTATVSRAAGPGENAGGTAQTAGTIALPAGAQVLKVAPLGSDVLVHIREGDGDSVIVFDPSNGDVTRRWRLQPDGR